MNSSLVLLKPSAAIKVVERSNATGLNIRASVDVFENFRKSPRTGKGMRGKKIELVPFNENALVARECWVRFKPLLGKIIKRAYVEQIKNFKKLDEDGLGLEFGTENVAGILNEMKRNRCEITVETNFHGREFRYVISKKGDFYEVHEMTSYPLVANVFVEKTAGTQKGSIVFSFSYLMANMIVEPQKLLNSMCSREELKRAVDATGAELRFEMWDYDSYAVPHAVVAYLPAEFLIPSKANPLSQA